MKALMPSRKIKLLSKVLLCCIACSLLINYFQTAFVTYGGGGGEKGSSGEEEELFENTHLELVLTVMALPENKLESVNQMVNSTWGAEALGHYRLVVGTSLDNYSANILQGTECCDFKLVADDSRQLYCLLKAIYYSHVNEYKWFLIASEMIYPSLQKLERYLVNLNSHAFLYMGEREPIHNYCSVKSGLLLSRKALHTIVHELEGCMLSGGPGEAGNAVLGMCIAAMVHESCLQINKVRLSYT